MPLGTEKNRQGNAMFFKEIGKSSHRGPLGPGGIWPVGKATFFANYLKFRRLVGHYCVDGFLPVVIF